MNEARVEFDVPVPLRDGTILRADVYRPSDVGPWPVIVERTPYDKRSPHNPNLVDALAAVRRGYIVVYQDTRGRYASEGDWLPWACEAQDGFDTVEWAAALPGSDGTVGMFGASYTGNTQWSTAISQPPQLKAIAPMETWSDPADGLMFRGGAIELGLNLYWTLLVSLGQVPREHQGSELAARLGRAVHDLDNLAEDGYWQLPAGATEVVAATSLPDIGVARALADSTTMDESRVAGKYKRVQVPALNIGGWYDVFQQGTIDSHVALRGLGRPSRLIVGPWDHNSAYGTSEGRTGEVVHGFGSITPGPEYESLCDVLLSWFDHWLKGGPATELHESGVRIFVLGANEWRDEPEWPLARAVDTPLFLREEGLLSFDAPELDHDESRFVYDPEDPVPTLGGAHVMSVHFPSGPVDQRRLEERPDVLVYTSEPLEADLEITGQVRANLFATTDVVSTDWVVRLCVVDERDVSYNLVDGIVRAETVAGLVRKYDVDLWSTSVLVKAGQRLRVHVTSSNFPRWDRNLNTGAPVTEGIDPRVANQTVFHDRTRASHLVLPVVPR